MNTVIFQDLWKLSSMTEVNLSLQWLLLRIVCSAHSLEIHGQVPLTPASSILSPATQYWFLSTLSLWLNHWTLLPNTLFPYSFIPLSLNLSTVCYLLSFVLALYLFLLFLPVLPDFKKTWEMMHVSWVPCLIVFSAINQMKEIGLPKVITSLVFSLMHWIVWGGILCLYHKSLPH